MRVTTGAGTPAVQGDVPSTPDRDRSGLTPRVHSAQELGEMRRLLQPALLEHGDVAAAAPAQSEAMLSNFRVKAYESVTEMGAPKPGERPPQPPPKTPEKILLAAYPRREVAQVLLKVFDGLLPQDKQRMLAKAEVSLEVRYGAPKAPKPPEGASPEEWINAAYPNYAPHLVEAFRAMAPEHQAAFLAEARARFP
jgi:hypothetical protein